MDKIKAFLETWNHRLHGHLLVTYWGGSGYTSLWARDVFTGNGKVCIDPADLSSLPYIVSADQDIVITG